jgi:hypothetical protein
MMDSANLPSQADLNSLYGAWNPMSYMQGQQNQDLAAQFRDQAYQSNQNEVTQGALKNEQASLMNPLLLTQQGLTNTGLDLGNQSAGIKNASAGIDLGTKTALAPQDLENKRLGLQNQLGDEQYNALSNQISMSYLKALHSGNADEALKLKPMVEFLSGPIGEKLADRSQKRDLEELRSLTQLGVANITAEGRMNSAGQRTAPKASDPFTAFNKLNPATRAGVVKMGLESGINPVTHEPMTADDKQAFTALYQQDVAVVDQQAALRGQTQGATAAVGPDGKIAIVNKQVPSVAGNKQPSVADMRAALKGK